MSGNPYEPPQSSIGDPEQSSDDLGRDSITSPTLVYTAIGNIEAHVIVHWLLSHGIRAYAVEDHSIGSFFQFGILSQIHKPQVFVDKIDVEIAGELLRQFEAQRKRKRSATDAVPPIQSECEECGTTNEFPASQNGTTQNCPNCDAFMDVGTDDWPEDFDFGEADDLAVQELTDEEAFDAAIELDSTGDWHEAISAYRDIAERWPQHRVYTNNCISAIQHKIDTAAS